jgi:hypothetical protein
LYKAVGAGLSGPPLRLLLRWPRSQANRQASGGADFINCGPQVLIAAITAIRVVEVGEGTRKGGLKGPPHEKPIE